MKKLFFTLAICLFSLGAFASNGISEHAIAQINDVKTFQQSEELLSIKCEITVTITTTIDHGTWVEIIVVEFTYPCE